jgi:hypothetical protein
MDPPHLLGKEGSNSTLIKQYGCLFAETWQSDLKRGFAECWRVLDDYGVFIFKWNDLNITVDKVLNQFPVQPLFGQVTSGGATKGIKKTQTYWFCFMKIPECNGKA